MAAPRKAKEKILLLRSSDNEEFEVNESAAIQSVMLKKMIEDDCANIVIPVPNVIEYCNKHAEPTGPGDAVGATNKSAEDWLKIFDADFVIVEQDTLIDLMLAANYLDIKGLLNLTRQMVKGKMPEEVCEVKIQKKLSTSSTPALTTTMSSKRKDMEARFQIYLAKKQETAMEMLTGFAVNGEERRKLGRRPEQPPLQIVNYPELFDIAWGWDSILPYFPVHPWCLYMTYLQEYYKRNSPEVSAHQLEANAATGPDLNGDDGNDLTTLFNSCISLEDQLLNMLSRCDKKHNVDEISLKDKFTNFAHQTTIVEYAGFMTTSVALKADCYDKTGSEMGIVGGNIGEMNVAKQTIKVCNESADKVSLKENVVANTNKFFQVLCRVAHDAGTSVLE
ncbi:hypothetical protein C2845_PM05G26780 [Panicum miliaceum]|uniref:SKP1 component POZ domain-containing protein n=1 Tax=Panicum miliaceum TaxID=4540 RepID=A0A3L6SWZ4_PANMI|nr:hypothetical protein C2845_PM05G26780 [Panicum miliaceum]